MKNYNKKINRIEVIDWVENEGRILGIQENDIYISTEIQDDGRTLKVFINKSQ